jgi:hypothetical protein
MIIVYRDGPYDGQDDYLLPPPRRLRAWGGDGHYQRTRVRDGMGRIVYQWVSVPSNAAGGRAMASAR